MKLIFLMAITALNAFEQTNYPFFEGKSNEEIAGKYLGLHKDYLQDTLVSMFLTGVEENLDLPEQFDWRNETDCINPVRD